MSAFVRIDDRLVHGQVIHGWVKQLDIALIVVADQEVWANQLDQQVFSMAMPPGVEIDFVEPANVQNRLEVETRTALVLFRTPVQAVVAVEAGFQPTSINLGNLHFCQGKQQLHKTFSCDDAELGALAALCKRGISIAYQPAPSERKIVTTSEDLSRWQQ